MLNVSSKTNELFRSELPFSQWSSDEIASWLHDMGLHLYVSEAQRWNCRGQQLLEVPIAEIEKELSVKHPLHKKKLILALEAKGRGQDPMSLIPILPGRSFSGCDYFRLLIISFYLQQTC